ncbi:hypothetical protein Patl1_12614 [Pistacia atlantica]|uniref:Uncharacterized protein n=1 Tax=Pistacia atlantica TaxID=434234 RepID=A0ACC1AT39_9ROSI|nr:hypothetical protein Patl1_12614 [Pistacia atlantica]
MKRSCCCSCRSPVAVVKKSPRNMSSVSLPSKVPIRFAVVPPGTSLSSARRTVDMNSRAFGARASMVDSYESSSNFIRRMEQAWLISQQPMPVSCSSCHSNGHIECKWCRGTGFFILGDNMLCQVPSRNTTCVICAGRGSMCCSDCKGTGFRAKWLGEPPIPK